jgi:threonine dehydrogenase-like Zn-dependent dehydrogenase
VLVLVRLPGGAVPVGRFLPGRVELIWNRRVDPGRVLDLSLRLEEATEGYRAMDQRRATRPYCGPRCQRSPTVPNSPER